METLVNYHIPLKPFSPIDALNRRAAAVGSPRYAQLTENASYNGHHVTLRFNDYKGYYITEYFWAGRRVLARGSLEACLSALLAEARVGAVGFSASISVKLEDAEKLEAYPEIVKGKPDPKLSWWTWKHDVAVHSVADYAHPNTARTPFNWPLLNKAKTEDEYYKLLRREQKND